MKTIRKNLARQKRHWRIRKKVIGTPDKPRMHITRTLKHIYVQFVNDLDNRTILTYGTVSKDFKKRFPQSKKNKQTAAFLGELAAEKILGKGIKKVVFDRSGYKYHGRIQALAEAARKKGLDF